MKVPFIGVNPAIRVPKIGVYTLKGYPDYFIYKEGNSYVAKDSDGAIARRKVSFSDVLQWAVDESSERGATIWLARGNYTLDNEIELKSGITIEGDFPVRKYNEPDWPDASSAVITGGTVLQGNDSFPAFTGKRLQGISLKNLAFKNFSYGLKFGEDGERGVCFGELVNLYFDNCTEESIYIKNFQHIYMRHIKAIVPDGKRFIHLDNDMSWCGGNSVIEDTYACGGKGTDGVILIEGKTWLLTFVRPQVNMYGSSGNGSGIRIVSPAGLSTFIAVDIEGDPYACVKIEGSDMNYVHINVGDTNDYLVYLTKSGAEDAYWNIIISNERDNARIKNDTSWDNFYIGGLRSVEGGIYGVAVADVPGKDDRRPALISGNSPDFFWWFGKDWGEATIPAGQTKVTVNHYLVDTPKSIIVTPTANLGNVWVENVTSNSFEIHCETAPATDTKVYYLVLWKT